MCLSVYNKYFKELLNLKFGRYSNKFYWLAYLVCLSINKENNIIIK